MRFSSKLWRQECSISIILKSFKRRTHVDEISDDQITCHQRGLTKLCLDPKFYTYLAQLFMKPCIRPTVKFGFYFLLKIIQIPSSFCLFSSFCHYNFNLFISVDIHKFKKHRWCAWDSNLWPQDGRRRLNHGAIAAPQYSTVFNFGGKTVLFRTGRKKDLFGGKIKLRNGASL